MAFGSLFTTSDIGGGRPFTRIKGQLLLGYPSGDPGGHSFDASPTFGGTAGQPLLSFYNRPDTGLYSSNLTSSAAALGFAVGAGSIAILSTIGYALLTTAAGGFASTGGTLPTMFIMQTTAASAAGTVGPALNAGAALQWDSATKTLEVFSTVTGAWMRLHSSTGANLTYSSS